jgi:signal transduction histidine kinase
MKKLLYEEMVAQLRMKEKSLRDLREEMQKEGKPFDKQLHDDLNLIHNLLAVVQQQSKMRFQRDKAVQAADKAADALAESKNERRQWLERLCLLSIDMRELAQEVRFAALAKSLPKKEVQNEG